MRFCLCQDFPSGRLWLVEGAIYQGNSLLNRPPQNHLSKGNAFLASSFSSAFNALFFENVLLIFIGPTYNRGIMQNFAAMGASTFIPSMEIVSNLTATLTERIMSP
jgi:hypothetical protein